MDGLLGVKVAQTVTALPFHVYVMVIARVPPAVSIPARSCTCWRATQAKGTSTLGVRGSPWMWGALLGETGCRWCLPFLESSGSCARQARPVLRKDPRYGQAVLS